MVERTRTRITLADVAAFDEDEWIEVVNGELVRQDMNAAGYQHIVVIENVYGILDPFVRKNRLGRVHSDGLSYVLWQEDDGTPHTRLPDVSFIRRGRLPKDFDRSLPFPGAPDLAVEVVSPNEAAESIQAKIADYRRGGSEQIWVIYPSQKTIHVYERDHTATIRVYDLSQSFEAPTLFPGLTIRVADLFVMDDE